MRTTTVRNNSKILQIYLTCDNQAKKIAIEIRSISGTCQKLARGGGGWNQGGSHFFQLSKRGGSERIESLSRGGSENNVPILYLILIDFVTIFTTCDQFNILKCLLSKAKANNGSAICLVFILSCHKLNKEIC